MEEIPSANNSYEKIVERIGKAAMAAGRHPEEIKLVAVSKYHSVPEILGIYNEGQRDFGENKVQDMLDKAQQLPQDICWHLIGHLQTNKVKYIIGKTTLIHSLDRAELAREIEKRSSQANVITKCLVQVNSTGIDGRFGVAPEETLEFLAGLRDYPHIQVCGLMGMAPPGEDATKYFVNLKVLFDQAVRQEGWENGILSMGMSGDFESAILCGSTMLRVGRVLFQSEESQK